MIQRDRHRSVALACVLAIAWLAAIAPRADAQPATEPPPPPPPPVSDVCPAIEEDGLLCSADLLSGNCADFVAAADRLGGLYRAELAQLPGSEGSLLTTTWWGCGPGNLSDIAALLTRIASPRAQALLKQPPYATLLAQQAPPPPPPAGAPPPPAPPPDCDELASPLARNACIGTRLQQARAENQATFARCQPLVPAGLRDDFADSQSTFQSLLPIRCNAQATGIADKNLATFIRSRCLVSALDENTRGMLAAHPECGAGD